MSTSHDSKFVINNIVLDIAPENITIDRSSHIKQYSPLRTKGTAKVRSNQSVISITASVKFDGIDSINNKLRHLLAQFMLTPFCYIDNQFLKDSILGNSEENLALVLQNLTISTIEGYPETWNVVFSFIFFNYKPFSKDFRFKSEIFQSNYQLTQMVPGKPFEIFYRNQLKKLKPITLTNSNLDLSVLEFLLSETPPEQDNSVSNEVDLDKLRTFELSTQQFITDTEKIFDSLGTDAQGSTTAKQILSNTTTFENPLDRINSLNGLIDSLTSAAKSERPNDVAIKNILNSRTKLLQDAPFIFKGRVWLEFPANALDAKNAFGKARLFYRRKLLSTQSGNLDSGIVATSITLNFNHKLAIIPMQGYQYPTVQHLGSSDITLAAQFAILDDDSNREFADFWNTSQNNLQYARFIPQEITSIKAVNELFAFCGVENVLMQDNRETTVEGHPGLYQYQISFVENNFKVFDTEQIQAVPVSFREVRKLVWKAIWDNLNFERLGTRVNLTSKPEVDESSKQFLVKLVGDPFLRSTIATPGLNTQSSELLDQLGIDNLKTSKLLGVNKDFSVKALTASLTDDQVLAIEGFSQFFLLGKGTNRFSKGNATPALSETQIAEARNAVQNNSIILNERLKFLKSFLPKARTALNSNSVKINGNSFILNDGTKVSSEELFPGQGLKLFERNRENIQNGTLNADATRSSKVLGTVILDLEKELIDLEVNSTSSGSVRDPFFDLFKQWNLYTVNAADDIIDSYIDLPIFSEARKLYGEMTKTSKRTLYADMDFGNIVNEVKMDLGITSDDLRLEPDFFYWNESSDGGIPIDVKDIQSVKDRTLDYVKNISGQNLRWYQDTYIKKTNPEMAEFLIQSNPAQQPVPLDFSIKGVSSLSEIDKEIDVSSRSANAFTKNLKGKYQVNTNNAGKLGPKSQDVNSSSIQSQPLNSESGLTDPLSSRIISNEISSSYGAWLHPFPAATITSTPGYRDVIKTNSWHAGTDLAYATADQTLNKPVYSSLDGIVQVAGNISGGGNAIFIESITELGNIVCKYMHLNGFAPGIGVDANIKAGQLIGLAGNTGTRTTGPHLHFEVERSDGTIIYPFGATRGDSIITSGNGLASRTVLVADLIPTVSGTSPYLPGTGLEGISAGASALDNSIKQISADWNTKAGYRMNRAFPSFYLAFIEEDLDNKYIYKFDDYFSFASVVSLYVVKDRKVPADYVMMEVTNLSGMLSNRKFQGTYNEENPIFKGKEARSADGRRDSNIVDTQDEDRFESLMLREGIKVEIRLGYSNDPDNLDIVFIGRIASVQFAESDDLIQVEMQSLATELVQDLKGESKVETADGVFVSDARTGPLLESLISSPECVSFGFWKRGNPDPNDINRDLLTDRWSWNPEPQADNIFAPPSAFLDPRKMTLGKSMISRVITGAASGVGVALGAATSLSVTAAAVAVFSPILAGESLLNSLGLDTFVPSLGEAANATTNSDFQPKDLQLFSALTYYLYQTTIWDVFKEMEHRHPDCISSPVPYIEKLGGRTRMTMFFGNPDWVYFARDPFGSENVKTQEIKDRAEQLKMAIKSKGKEDRLDLLKDFADQIQITDESTKLIPGMLNKLSGTDIDESVFEDIDRFIDNERLQKALTSGSIRPFRNYHIVTANQHIIANNIKAKSSNVYNAISINYAATDGDVTIDESEGPHIDDVQEMTMKLDPLIPDEYVREGVFTYPNCQGDEMAKRYAISHLVKNCWDIYQGDLVILGNPSIKPYDIVFIYDDYTDMYGSVQVQRVVHFFDEQQGFITVITPDLITTSSEGTSLTQFHAMGLVAEHFLGLNNVVSPGNNPLVGDEINPWKLALASATMGLASFFGAKKLLFMTQFGHPVRIHPLIYQGQALVAGFGPPGVRENEFIVNDLYSWIQTRSRAVSDTMDDFANMFKNRKGLLNTRGSIFSSTGGIGGDSKFDALRRGKK